MSKKTQSGYVAMLLVVVLGVIVSLWVSTQHLQIISLYQTSLIEERKSDLKAAKKRLLRYAVLHPEIYVTNSSGDMNPAWETPAPGFLPCPDMDGDGFMSGGGCQNPFNNAYPDTTGFVPDPELDLGTENCGSAFGCMGYLPSLISSRHFYFAEKKSFFYVVDERFVYRNNGYNTTLATGFSSAPYRRENLNPLQIQTELDNDAVPIGLSINGQSGFVAILIDPGEDGQLDGDINTSFDADGDGDPANDSNNNGDRFFFSAGAEEGEDLNNSPNRDVVIGIHFDEWAYEVAQRICREVPKWEGKQVAYNLAGLDVNFVPLLELQAHWANPYRDDLLTPNPFGSGLAQWGAGCETVQ